MSNPRGVMDMLAATQGRIAVAVAGLRPAQLRFKPAPETIGAHLRGESLGISERDPSASPV